MRALVVYESMFGATHLVAEAIGEGLSGRAEVAVVPVGEADAAMREDVDLLVVGGPTHAHGMSRSGTRASAADMAEKPDSDLIMDPASSGPGVREWLDSLGSLGIPAAAFDTRIDGPPALTGRASKGIAGKLRKLHCSPAAQPESFLVNKESKLKEGEVDRAREWGATLAGNLVTAAG